MTPQMTMLIMLVVTLAAAMYVAWPLLVGRVKPEDYLALEGAEPVLQRLYTQRDGTYSAMKELEFDFRTGKLSEHDFQELQERYKKKAVTILKRIDDARSGRLARAALDDLDGLPDVERPRTARRTGAGEASRVDLDIEQEIEAFRRKSRESGEAAALTCPQCGRPVKDPDAAFCSKCGASIGQKQPRSNKKTGKH